MVSTPVPALDRTAALSAQVVLQVAGDQMKPDQLDRTSALAALAVLEVATNELRRALGFQPRPFDYAPRQEEALDDPE